MLIRSTANSSVNPLLESDVTYLSPSFTNCDRIYELERRESTNNQRTTRIRNCVSVYRTLLDSTTFCYSIISTFMISAGVVVLFVTSKERNSDKIQENYMGNNAQLWIIGPIFLAAGLLICVKGTMHLYKDRRPGSNRTVAGLQESQSTIVMPPSYSNALLSSMPRHFVQECKSVDVFDYDRKESIEAPPPSYSEALRLINCSDNLYVGSNRAVVHGETNPVLNASNTEFYLMHE